MKKKQIHGFGLVEAVSLVLVIVLIGAVEYIVFQATPASQEQAKEIAESKFNEVKAQTEPVGCEELWKNPKAMVSTPSLVRTVDEKPF